MSYVLIVDDDKDMAEAIADMVSLYDWKTVIVHGPRAAIKALQVNPPSLILLDMNMPGVNGLEVCRYIKRDPISGHTPVAFVTAEDAPEIRKEALEAGASEYFVKPIDLDLLEKLLESLPQ